MPIRPPHADRYPSPAPAPSSLSLSFSLAVRNHRRLPIARTAPGELPKPITIILFHLLEPFKLLFNCSFLRLSTPSPFSPIFPRRQRARSNCEWRVCPIDRFDFLLADSFDSEESKLSSVCPRGCNPISALVLSFRSNRTFGGSLLRFNKDLRRRVNSPRRDPNVLFPYSLNRSLAIFTDNDFSQLATERRAYLSVYSRRIFCYLFIYLFV